VSGHRVRTEPARTGCAYAAAWLIVKPLPKKKREGEKKGSGRVRVQNLRTGSGEFTMRKSLVKHRTDEKPATTQAPTATAADEATAISPEFVTNALSTHNEAPVIWHVFPGALDGGCARGRCLITEERCHCEVWGS
jgi:hypothetical protein